MTTVTVKHRFAASAECVYDAWLDPEKARRFLFTTATGEIVRCDLDARVGGRYVIVDRRAGEDVLHEGTYLELDRPRRIVFTLRVPKYSSDEDRVTIDIEPLGKGCELTLTTETADEWADDTRRGWAIAVELQRLREASCTNRVRSRRCSAWQRRVTSGCSPRFKRSPSDARGSGLGTNSPGDRLRARAPALRRHPRSRRMTLELERQPSGFAVDRPVAYSLISASTSCASSVSDSCHPM